MKLPNGSALEQPGDHQQAAARHGQHNEDRSGAARMESLCLTPYRIALLDYEAVSSRVQVQSLGDFGAQPMTG